jgi:hypothetical protein
MLALVAQHLTDHVTQPDVTSRFRESHDLGAASLAVHLALDVVASGLRAVLRLIGHEPILVRGR